MYRYSWIDRLQTSLSDQIRGPNNAYSLANTGQDFGSVFVFLIIIKSNNISSTQNSKNVQRSVMSAYD